MPVSEILDVSSEQANLEERLFLRAEYPNAASIRLRGQILRGALARKVFRTAREAADFLGISPTTASLQISAASIPESVWCLYVDETKVSTWHSRRLVELGKKFGWRRIEKAVEAVVSRVQSQRPPVRFNALLIELDHPPISPSEQSFAEVPEAGRGRATNESGIRRGVLVDKSKRAVTIALEDDAQLEKLLKLLKDVGYLD